MNSKSIHKIITLFLIAGAIMLAGLGCKGLSEEEQQAITPVTLNYWTVFDDVDQLRAFAEEYSALHTYVTINIRQVRYEEFDNLFTNALADDVAPDMVSMHSRWLSRYVQRLEPAPANVSVATVSTEGKVQPKIVVTKSNNLLPSINTIKKSYVSTVAEDIIIDDKIYGLPLAFDTLTLYYNKELLDKAGVAVVPATWEEFNSAVKKGTHYDQNGKITQSGVAMGTGKNIDNGFDIISLLMLQNGVKMATGGRVSFTDGLDGRATDHPALQAMRFYTDFARPTKDVYSWDENMGNALEEFARGKSVFFFGFAYDRPRVKARGPQINFGVEPVPQLNSAVPMNVANYWVESVVVKSKNKNEAWDFIRFMSEPENIKRYVEATKQPSPLRAQIVEQQDNPELAPFALQSLTAKSWYHGKDITAAQTAFNDLFVSYLQPYGEREDAVSRDVNLLNRTAQVIQQTM